MISKQKTYQEKNNGKGVLSTYSDTLKQSPIRWWLPVGFLMGHSHIPIINPTSMWGPVR